MTICLVSGIIERATASVADREDASEPVYLDARAPDERGFLKKPWAALTDGPGRAPESIEEPSEVPQCSQTSSLLHRNGVSIQTSYAYKIHCFQFSSTEAAAVQRLHDSLR